MSNMPAKILVIDDNEDILTMTKIMLEIKGYHVATKSNTVQLEDFIKEFMPDLIIMDMLLSGADGREICKSLKEKADLAHISILMISAHPHAKQECLASGADYFLGKPFEIQEFFQTVEKALSN
jgi:DNA-binding response OmpR family regulator